RGASFKNAADPVVHALGVLAENHEVDLCASLALEGRKTIHQQLARAEVDEQVQSEAQAEKNLPSVRLILHPGVPHRTEEDRIVVLAEVFDLPGRKPDAGLEESLGPEIELLEDEPQVARGIDRLEDAESLAGDLDPRAVSWNYGNAGHGDTKDNGGSTSAVCSRS